MSDAQCIQYRIRPGQRDALVNWIASLSDRSAELEEAFAEAGLVAEAVFLATSDSGDYILIYSNARNLQAATQALASSDLPIVREFNQLLSESVDVEEAVSLEILFHTS